MDQYPIQIGPIRLQDFEVPEAIQFGGRYRFQTHKLAGGLRVIEPLGPDDGDISFHGTLSGADAETRARLLDQLRLSGQNVSLTWKSFQYQVIIKSFIARYRSPWWISYHLVCTVTLQPGADPVTASSLIDIASDMESAISYSSGIVPLLVSLEVALKDQNAVTPGTMANMRTISASAAALAAADQQITTQSGILVAARCSNPGSAASAFVATVADAGALAKTVAARAYIGRISRIIESKGP